MDVSPPIWSLHNRTKAAQKSSEAAYALQQVSEIRDAVERARLLDQVFLTQAGKPKADTSLFTKKMAAAAPGLELWISEAREHIVALRDRLSLVRMLKATLSALTLAMRQTRITKNSSVAGEPA